MTQRLLLTCAALTTVGAALAASQWQLVPAQSRLGFTAVQAGANFDGSFKRFNSNVQFDPTTPANCRLDVTIDMASVDTQDAERDGILKDADLFNAKQFPTARYVADRCASQGKQFVGYGKLTLRNVTRDVPITFTFDSKQGTGTLRGNATIKRLDFGVGQGEWKDTQWVANDVKVNFTLQLKG